MKPLSTLVFSLATVSCPFVILACTTSLTPPPPTTSGESADSGGSADSGRSVSSSDTGCADASASEADASACSPQSPSTPPLDETLFGAPCSKDDSDCAENETCVRYQYQTASGPHCMRNGEICKPLTCPQGKCVELSSESSISHISCQ